MNKYLNEGFKTILDELNDKQRSAVEEIDGPVMVVAGPGTGKTQLLSARIANILSLTDATPSNILCLTYTDAGTVAMRQRLLKMIGPEAYNANIYTFHGFCNIVIRDNIEHFGGFRELQKVSDLELVDIVRQIIDEFPDDHILKRLRGQIYYEEYRLKKLYQTLKQESWTLEMIEEAFVKYEKQLMNDPDLQYKTSRKNKETGEFKWKAGDPKMTVIGPIIKKCKMTIAAARSFDRYNELLAESERFDFQDMILWVIKALEKNDDLNAFYQEKYQYILVDEYQDTNGSQNKLLFLLTKFWGKDANLFVVGDDDQAIYRFQGANMDNIVDFKEKYEPKVVVLDNNYRSSQQILDRSTQIINNNNERLVSKFPELTKELIESKKDCINVEPKFIQYHNPVHEDKAIADKIIHLQKSGVDLSKVAVITRKHKNVQNLVKYLHFNGVPINQKKKINCFDIPEIQRLLNILSYLSLEYKQPYSGEHLLFEIMHYDYFGLKPKDVGIISIHCSRKTDEVSDDIRWRDFICKEDLLKIIGVSDVDKIIHVSNLLESWERDIANVTIQTLFEKILTEAEVINQILALPDKAFRLQIVNTFFDLIKNETAKNPKLSLKEMIDMIDKMIESSIDLPLNKIIYSKQGVNFLTAHGSKGLEFEHVFMIRCHNKNWIQKNAGGSSFTFPGTMVPISETSDVEDDRRLFYVAMTRAEHYLEISYPGKTEEGKELEAVLFIHEALKDTELKIEEVHVDEDKVLNYTADLMRYSQGKSELIEHELIDRVLEKYTISVTHLNKYLRCPLAFYFENILRIPMARNVNMGFGNVIHFTLEEFFIKLEKNPTRTAPSLEVMLELFQKGMTKYRSHFSEKDYKLRNVYGQNVLTAYYNKYANEWGKVKKYIVEHPIRNAEYNGIPINGKIDKVLVYEDHYNVVDYKTGSHKYSSKKLKGPKDPDDPKDHGGDYWRQLVFYKMLMKSDTVINKAMRKSIIDFVEPVEDKFLVKELEISDEDISIVEKQLEYTHKNIHAHNFEEGCNEEDCKWCNFVNNNFSLDADLDAYLDEAENQELEEIIN